MGAYAGVVESAAGLLIALGLFTRPAAFIASGTMAVAYWMAHAPQNFFPVNNGGDAAILFCFVFLYLVFAGPGAWSVDGVRLRSEEHTSELQSLMRNSYAVFCLKKKKTNTTANNSVLQHIQ